MPSIRNEYLAVRISLDGGELDSIVDLSDGEELLFKGDSSIWDRSDCVLFPFVGRQKNGFYLHNGNKYEVQIHGIAPYKKFVLHELKENSVTVSLTSDSETMRIYPFPFQLQIRYRLKKNELKVEYKVTNTGEKPMYFYLGSHPGLKIDKIKGEQVDDTSGNWLDFNCSHNATYTLENNFLSSTCPIDDRIELKKDYFVKYPSLVVERNAETVTLERKCGKKVNVTSSSPIICVWQPEPKGGLCAVESWWGLPDFWTDTERELKNKKLINVLEPQKEFKCDYKLEFIAK